MKNMIKLPAIALGLMLLLTGITQKVMAQDEDISLQSFYDELSPYGTWIQDPQYGYVWRPDVSQGEFRPYYTNGRWVMTEYGNTWVSNYDWGWAPFHYGRWVYNNYNQWIWIPDTTWGPAWVSWRSGGGYYGWAPMGPGMSINVNLNIPSPWWVFVPQRNIYYDSFPRYYSRRNVVIINNTTIINNTYVRNRNTYFTGPRSDEIRRYTGRDVNVYSVNRTSRPGRGGVSGRRLDIYTPARTSRGATSPSAPKDAIRAEGYATARPDRASTDSRPQRNTEQGTVPNNRVNDARGRVNPAANRSSEGTRPGRAAVPPKRIEQAPVQRSAQPQPAPAQRESNRVIERKEQPKPQPRQEAPQRQERRPEPQPQRIQQAKPSVSPGSRTNQGGGRTGSSRPTRSGRG